MKAHNTSGFSLLEILIAMAVLTVGIVAVVNLIPMGLNNARVAQDRSMAAELADSDMGRIKMAGARELMGALEGQTSTDSSLDALGTASSMYSAEAPDLQWSRTIQQLHGAGGTSLQRVVFTVELSDGTRETFVTYVSDI